MPTRRSAASGPSSTANFAEHLGSCVYGGMWVGKNSQIPNINGFRKAAVDYLKETGVPVLRWPGGCFADDYHWRDGIGPAAKRPKRVNIHWGNYTEDNSFGTHEFIEFCRLIGAEPYFAAQRGHRHSAGDARLDGILQLSQGQRAFRRARRERLAGAVQRQVLGRRQRALGCGGNMQPQQAALAYRHFATFAAQFRRNSRSTWWAAAPTATMRAGHAASWRRWARRECRATRCTSTRTASSRPSSSLPKACTRSSTSSLWLKRGMIQQRALAGYIRSQPADRA